MKKDSWLWFRIHCCSEYIDTPLFTPSLIAGIGMVFMILILGSLAIGAISAAPMHHGTHMIGAAGIVKQLVEKRNELEAKRLALAKVFEEAKTDDPNVKDFDKVKSLGDGLTTLAKVEKVRAMNTELDALFDEVKGLASTEQAESNLKRIEDATKGTLNLHPGGGGDPQKQRTEQKSAGTLFIESDAFKKFQRGSSQGPVASVDIEAKTLLSTSAGWSPQAVRTDIVTMYPTRPAPFVTDFIPTLPTSQSAVVYMEETTFTNNATETTEGSTFGEAALALTERSVTVRKVAIFLPITDEQLEDVPMVEAYVNQRLTLMLQQRLDLQVLGGTGVMPSGLVGTENVANIQTQALSTDSIPDAIFKLFTSIRESGFAEPTVLFIRPSKWQTVALLKTADGLYIWGHPSENGPTRIWGVPVVQTTAVTSTKAIAGDYQTHSFLAIKRGIDFQISNSHSTYFVEGKQAIRADMRCAMIHLRPSAFGQVTGL